MDYVMVPVPEEIQKEIRVFLGRLAFHETFSQWVPEKLDQVMGSMDQDETKLVDLLLSGHSRSVAMTVDRMVRELAFTPERIAELTASINERCTAIHKPPLVVSIPQPWSTDQSPGAEVFSLAKSAARVLTERKVESAGR